MGKTAYKDAFWGIGFSVIAALALHTMALRAVHASSQQDITDAGDILQIAVPLTALGGTFLADDPEGR